MNVADAMALALLAFADLAVLAHLRKARAKREQMARMWRCLRFAVGREIGAAAPPRLGRAA